jgi:adenylate kinase family enzyme
MSLFMCLLGPPAVGKTTISNTLADRGGVQVFRLREFAKQLRVREPQAGRLFVSRDPLGWFGDGAVAYCLRRAFVDDLGPAGGVVVLENLPGSQVQVGQVHAVAAGRGVPLVLVELAAPEAVLRRRAEARRVCPTCEHDLYGDPYVPARVSADDPDVCGGCGGKVAPRRADRPAIFTARLARFHERIDDIRRAAAVRRRPYHTIDAAAGLDDCLEEVLAVCRIHLNRHGVEEALL